MTVKVGYPHVLRIADIHRVAAGGGASLAYEARPRVRKSREVLDRFVDDRLPIYGVSTQFGDDAYRVQIHGTYPEYIESTVRRQNRVIQALGCGLGEEAPREVVRATMLLRAHALGQGASGVREELIDAILTLLCHDVCPVIRRYGSVGASGDLVPLATVALVLSGLHEVRRDGKVMPAKEALRDIGMGPWTFRMKEGLSLVNGTSYMTAIASLAVHRLCHLLPVALAAAATVSEAMLAMDDSYEPFIHRVKNHDGQVQVAEFVKGCWEGSSLIRPLARLRREWRDMVIERGEAVQEHVQDYYSLRALAHGFGPFREDLGRAVRWVEEEANSANDNPVIDGEGDKVHHGANFLGDYVAVACDQLRADVAKAGTWLHALLGNLIHPRKNRGLPSNLMPNPDEQTGFKTLQLLVAALAIHNRGRALPVCAVMLPTEGDNQDMVSLGTHSAWDLLECTDNFGRIVAVLLLGAAQAIEIRGVERSSNMAKRTHAFVRQRSPFLREDRVLSGELEVLAREAAGGELLPPWFLND
jgi:phenylalanine ammonia-lyase